MFADLRDLLRERPIMHPSSITAAHIENNTLNLSVSGYPWWLSEIATESVGAATFHFAGISEGKLNLQDIANPEYDEALGYFAVDLVTDVPWLGTDIFQIYGNNPLPRPLELYAKLEDHLVSIGASKAGHDFLNVGLDRSKPWSNFAQITSRKSYLIGQGPECVRQVICDELDHQSVSFNVLPLALKPDDRLFVTIGSSAFLCQRAFAIWA